MSQDSEHTNHQIPEFATRQEEAEFWDSHDFSDFWDELEPIQIETGDNLARRVSLRLDANSLGEVCVLAHERGVKPRVTYTDLGKGASQGCFPHSVGID